MKILKFSPTTLMLATLLFLGLFSFASFVPSIAQPPPPPMFWKANFTDYAPSGMPDFDQRQDLWQDIWGTWTWCVPAAVANSLWWMDSRYENSTTPPPTINDTFPLVTNYTVGIDDHDPSNVQPFIKHLAYLMDTDGIRTGIIHSGTYAWDTQAGIAQYLSWTGLNPQGDVNGDGVVNQTDWNIVNLAMGTNTTTPGWNMAADIWPVTLGWPTPEVADNKVNASDLALVTANNGSVGMFYEQTVPAPDFYFIEEEVEKSEDVILFLGFWQYDPVTEEWVYREEYPYPEGSGHAVTVAGVNSTALQIAISDPIQDNAEPPPQGTSGPGRVLPPPPHNHPAVPPETLHNNATYVSHDIYNVTLLLPPAPLGNWALVNYISPQYPPGMIAVIEWAIIVSPLPPSPPPPPPPPMFWKANYTDYAPSGVPDFDQKQDQWKNPITGSWSWCGPTAVADSLWWLDSEFEPGNVPPPAISDGFPLVQNYTPGIDDHDPSNVVPFITDLGWYMDTDGNRTGAPWNGTEVHEMEKGIAQYLKDKGLDGMFYEQTVKDPTFEYIEWEIMRSEDVILLLGFWQEDPYEMELKRIGGHYVTAAGVNSTTWQIAISDPDSDNAEAGGPGRVLPGPHLPGHTTATHNNATYVSHDIYNVVGVSFPPPLGVELVIEDYWTDFAAFLGQNSPEEFLPFATDVIYDPAIFPVITKVEYAVVISPLCSYVWDQPYVSVQGAQTFFNYTTYGEWWVRLSSTGVSFTFTGVNPMKIVSEYLDVQFNLGITNRMSGEAGLDGLLDVVINPQIENYTITNVLFDNIDPSNHVYEMGDPSGTYLTKAHITVHKDFIHDGNITIKLERHVDNNWASAAPVSTNVPIDLGNQSDPTPIIPPNVYENNDSHRVHINVVTDASGTIAAPGEVVMRPEWLAPPLPGSVVETAPSPGPIYVWDQPTITVQGSWEAADWVRHAATGVAFTFSGINPMEIVSEYLDIEFSLLITNRMSGEEGLDGLLDVVINPDIENYTITNVLFDNIDPSNHVYIMGSGNGTYRTKAHVTVHKSYIHDGNITIKVERHTDSSLAPSAMTSVNATICLGTQDKPVPIVPPNVYENDDPHTVHIGVPHTGNIANPGVVVMRPQWLAVEVHDVAVINKTTFSSKHGQLGTYWGGPGGGPPLTPVTDAFETWTIEINVTVQNQGTFTDTFTVQAFYGNATGNYTIGISPASYSVTLAPGASTTKTFTWDVPKPAKVYPYWTYTIYANVSVVAGETDIADNVRDAAVVTVQWLGDATGDGKVNIYDLTRLALSWKKAKTDPKYNPKCDFTGDGEINIFDLTKLALNWKKGPDP